MVSCSRYFIFHIVINIVVKFGFAEQTIPVHGYVAFECGKLAKYYNETTASWIFYEGTVIRYCQNYDDIIRFVCSDVFGFSEKHTQVQHLKYYVQLLMCETVPTNCLYKLVSPYICREITSTVAPLPTTTINESEKGKSAPSNKEAGNSTSEDSGENSLQTNPMKLEVKLDMFKKSVERIEFANNVVDDLNKLILKHIETQVTTLNNNNSEQCFYKRLIAAIALLSLNLAIYAVNRILHVVLRHLNRRKLVGYQIDVKTEKPAPPCPRIYPKSVGNQDVKTDQINLVSNIENHNSEIEVDSVVKNEKYIGYDDIH